MTVTVQRLDKYKFHAAKWHSSRRGSKVDTVVLHYTAGKGDELSLAKFFARGVKKASAHFGVGRTGGVLQMVDLDKSAWHAGKSALMNPGIVGWRSVGIEICNSGWAYIDRLSPDRIYEGRHRNSASSAKRWEKFTDKQVEAVIELLKELKAVLPDLKYVVGHEDIRNVDVVPGLGGSKTDPGPAFPWNLLPLDVLELEQWHWSFRDKQWYRVPAGESPQH